jgi:hypothetical protein
MKTIGGTSITSLIAGTLLCALSAPLHAWEPNSKDLDAAIKSGGFSGYLTNTTAWLNQKMPPKPGDNALRTLLKDPVFLTVLDQRQLIARTGAEQLGAIAKADPSNQAFLTWLLKNTTPWSCISRDAFRSDSRPARRTITNFQWARWISGTGSSLPIRTRGRAST